MRPLVILRPEPAASATAERARAIGLDVCTIPLFEVVPLAWEAPNASDFDGIVLTSANAVRQVGPELGKLTELPVYAVGAATGDAAVVAGFTVAAIGEGGVKDMIFPAGARLLYLTGRDHLPSGAALSIAVYEARAIRQPSGLDALSGCVAAVHSPRAGRRLAALVADRAGIAIAAISPAAAAACGSGWEAVEAAAQPSDSALLALAARLCDSPAS